MCFLCVYFGSKISFWGKGSVAPHTFKNIIFKIKKPEEIIGTSVAARM